VAALARAIDADYRGRAVTLVVVLDGAAVFAADLMRQLTLPVSLAFIRARSYGSATRSSGTVRVSGLAGLDLAGRDAILVEDIVDSGLTARTLAARLKARGPASLALCALLHKPDGGAAPDVRRYVGFTVPDRFVVGYGMDYAGRYRNLPGVYALPDR
jgi:hypoxanthine phosphoribosyltransferase